jgi:hypothetical protein
LADFFPEGEDAEGFLDTAQGDVERVVLLGLMKDAFQAEFKEIQFIQARGLMGLVDLVSGGGQGPAQMFGVAGERADGEAVLGGQGAQGLPGLQSAVDLREGGVSADGTAFIQGFPFSVLKSSKFKVQSSKLSCRAGAVRHKSRFRKIFITYG